MKNFKRLDTIVWKAVNILFRKPSYALQYAFGDKEDAYQEAWLALIQEKFDLDTTDGAVLYRVIQRRLYDHMRTVLGRTKDNKPTNKGKALQSQSLDESLTHSDHQLETKPIAFERTLTNSIVEFLNNKMNVREQYIARMFFFENLTEKEIAKKLQVTESRVSQVKKKITDKIGKRFDRS